MAKIDVSKMMEGMRARLEQDEADGKLAGLSVEELAEAVSHPKAAEAIAELMEAEAASVQEGDPAPDFTLPRLPESGEELGPELTLSDHFGKRPVALVFGSYT
ncbi:MAG: hypothetical protein V3T07_01960 [Myxococcota bacterium]